MEKIKNSFAGIIFGIIFLIVGSILLWWNEKDVVKNQKTVANVKENVVEVDSSSINPNNNGKLIAIKGSMNVVDQNLQDYTFGVSVKSAKLVRKVEMYQWKEKSETNSNDKKEYKYEKTWEEKIIDSSSFAKAGHSNPTYMEYHGQTYIADEVKIGDFYLSDEQKKNSLSANKRLNLSESNYLPSGYSIHDNYITNSSNLSNPEIGDIRVSYEFNDYENVSVLAQQDEDSFVSYISPSGKEVNRVDEGLLTSKQIIQKMVSENKTVKWIFRGIGAGLLIIGYLLILNPIITLTSFVPILGGLVGSGLGFVGTLIGMIHSLLVIIVAWLRFRPVIAILLLLIVAILIVVCIQFTKKKTNNQNRSNNSPQMSGNQNVMPQQSNNVVEPTNVMPQQTSNVEEPTNVMPQQSNNVVEPTNVMPQQTSNVEELTNVMPQQSNNVVEPTNVMPQQSNNVVEPTNVMPQQTSNVVEPTNVIPQQTSNAESTNVIPQQINQNENK